MHQKSVLLFVFLVPLLLLVGLSSVGALRKQGIAISGRLLCGLAPADAATTKVKLVDIDTGPDPDDKLDEKFVDGSGSFKLKGFTRELSDIDPVLYIWTDCNDGNTPCQRKMKFEIPKKFIITDEPSPKDWVDLGVLNLANTFEEEKRECIKP